MPVAGPMAQLVSVGLRVMGAHIQVKKIQSLRCYGHSTFMSLLKGMVTVGGGRSQAKSVTHEGTGLATLTP